MKLPTLTAITLASAVMAAAPAFAAGSQNAAAPVPPPGPAAQSAGAAATPTPPAETATQNGASNGNAAATPSPKMTTKTTAPAAETNSSSTTTAAGTSGAAGSAMTGSATSTAAAAGMDHNATAPGHMQLTNNPPGTANVVPLTNGRNDNNNAKNERTPNERNPVLANDGLPRAGKVVGSAVYNRSDKKLGSVNDILMGERGHPDMVVLNLAQGNKRVLVPFHEFVFGNTQISDNNRVILPDQTPISLSQLAPFHYDLNHRGNGNNRVGINNAMTAGSVGLMAVPPRPPVTTAMNAKEPAPAATTVSAPTDGNLAAVPIGTATVRANKGEIIRNANATEAALPHQRNPVLADDGLPRASKVIGSAVYNTDDQKVGSVDEILMGEKGQPDQAVVNVNNGNNKRVLVPFKSLVFGNTRINSNNRVILPDQTEASLDHMQPFVYNGHNGSNG